MQDSDGARARGKNGQSGGTGLLAILLFLTITASCAAWSGRAFAADHVFTSVKVNGLQHIETGTVLSYAGIARGKPVSDAQLNDAYQRISNSGLFESVDLVPQGSQLVISVKEYPLINVINFEGNNRLKTEDLQKIIKSQSRKVYSPSTAEADAARITEAYRQQKRFAVIVTPQVIPRPNNRVDLVFKISEGKPTYVDRLSFIGNHDFSDYRLRQVLETKQAGTLRGLFKANTYAPDRIQTDRQQLEDFYHERGYIDFQVLDVSSQIQRDRNGFFLTYTISEGQPYTFGSTSIANSVPEVDPAELQKAIEIKPGQGFSPRALNAAVRRMETLTTRKGLNFIRITPQLHRDNRNLRVNVTFVVDRAPKLFVERIDIEGNQTTLDRVIRQQFHTVEGDPYNPREIEAAKDRIKDLGYFKDVQVNTKPGDTPQQVIIDVNVTEQPTGSLSLGGSYGVDAGLGAVISFSEKNFLGRGQQINLSINTSSNNANSSFSFVEPHLLGRDLKFTIGANYGETDHNYANYNTQTINIGPSIEFPVSERGRLALSYSFGRDSISNVDSDATPILDRESGGRTNSKLGYSYSYDTNSDGLNPDTNYTFRFGQQFAGVGGQEKYIQTTAFASAQTKIMRQSVTLRGELEGGVLTNLGGQDSTVEERFSLNGKMIGFETNGVGPRDTTANSTDALGGKMYAVARLEAQFPLGLPDQYGIKGGLFMNAGSVWGLDDTSGATGTVDDSFKLRATAGFSIFWKTPIGPLRFNFSHAFLKESYDKTQAFDFTISTTF